MTSTSFLKSCDELEKGTFINVSYQESEGGRTLRHLHVNGILLDLPSGKIMCGDHEVGSGFQVYGTSAFVFVFPCEIKQPLGSTEIHCSRMHNKESPKSSRTFINKTSADLYADPTLHC